MLVVGPLISLFWTSGDVPCGFQSQSGQPFLLLVKAYVLHIPWDLCLVPAWQPNCSLPHTCDQALVGFKTGIYHAATNMWDQKAVGLLEHVKLAVIDFKGCNIHWKGLSEVGNIAIIETVNEKLYPLESFLNERGIPWIQWIPRIW